MNILVWVIFGLIVGILAKWIMPGKDSGGIIVTIILGIIGSVVGGFIGNFLNIGNVNGFNISSFIIAIIGALLVLFIFRKIR